MKKKLKVCRLTKFVLRDKSPLECPASTSAKVKLTLEMVMMMKVTCRREAMELARLEVKLCSIRGGSSQGTRSPVKSLAAAGANICKESPTRMVGSMERGTRVVGESSCMKNSVESGQGSPTLAAPSAAR